MAVTDNALCGRYCTIWLVQIMSEKIIIIIIIIIIGSFRALHICRHLQVLR